MGAAALLKYAANNYFKIFVSLCFQIRWINPPCPAFKEVVRDNPCIHTLISKVYLRIRCLTNVTNIFTCVLWYFEKEIQTVWKHSIQ